MARLGPPTHPPSQQSCAACPRAPALFRTPGDSALSKYSPCLSGAHHPGNGQKLQRQITMKERTGNSHISCRVGDEIPTVGGVPVLSKPMGRRPARGRPGLRTPFWQQEAGPPRSISVSGLPTRVTWPGAVCDPHMLPLAAAEFQLPASPHPLALGHSLSPALARPVLGSPGQMAEQRHLPSLSEGRFEVNFTPGTSRVTRSVSHHGDIGNFKHGGQGGTGYQVSSHLPSH